MAVRRLDKHNVLNEHNCKKPIMCRSTRPRKEFTIYYTRRIVNSGLHSCDMGYGDN